MTTRQQVSQEEYQTAMRAFNRTKWSPAQADKDRVLRAHCRLVAWATYLSFLEKTGQGQDTT
jgi:hypothetical protein